MKHLLPVFCLLVAAAGAAPAPGRFELLVAEARARVRELAPEELVKKLAVPFPPVVIDVREESEWAAGGRIPGAIHVARGVLERDIEKTVPNADAEIVLYCQGGGRSALAADSLTKMGYGRVYSLRGGVKAWIAEGHPKL